MSCATAVDTPGASIVSRIAAKNRTPAFDNAELNATVLIRKQTDALST